MYINNFLSLLANFDKIVLNNILSLSKPFILYVISYMIRIMHKCFNMNFYERLKYEKIVQIQKLLANNRVCVKMY